jgi:hypothetical protein
MASLSAVALVAACAITVTPPASAATPGAASAAAASSKSAKLSISPSSHQYGTVVLGASSTDQSFAITNTGQAASGPFSVTVTGTDPADFIIDANTCTSPLPAGSACSVNVDFTPTATGARKATLSVTATPGGTVTSSLQGSGTQADLQLSSTTYSYGTVAIGAVSASQTYTVTNTGGGPSGPVSVAIGGANPGDFVEESNTCGPSLAAGTSCAVGIRFVPTTAGNLSAVLSVTSAPGGTATSTLKGTGAAKALLSISPSAFDYGLIVLGSTSAVQTYTVTNTGQSTSGTVTVAIGGTNAADFPQNSTTCGAKLATGASCTVSVHFTPSMLTTENATVSATASPGGTATAAVEGTGASPAALAITPTTFDFADTATGSNSDTQTFTVDNIGQIQSGPLSVSLTGANASEFTVESTTCGTALTGNGSCTVDVQFTPSAVGAGSATLSEGAM